MDCIRWPATRLASMLAALLLAGAPVAMGAEPNLSASFADPAYAFAATCDLSQPLVFINLVVANRRDTTIAQTQFTALDSAGVLQGDRTTQPLAPGMQITLQIPMSYVASGAGSIGGSHSITVMAGLRRLRPLTVPVPATLCVTPIPSAGSSRVHRTVPSATANVPPSYSRVGDVHSNAANAILASVMPAVPGNVRNANGVQDCVAHVGLLGALVCPDLIRSGRMQLVWDWQAGAGPDQIDGYRVYRVDGAKRLIYTRADKKDITLFDAPLPAGGYPGTCYAVSAYAGTFESGLSPAFCPTRGQTIVLAKPTVPSPTPKPRAPTHVDIHVTSDSYPVDTIVAAGGDVTWINDDTDAHTVEDLGLEWGGVIEGNGGKFTHAFRDIGLANYPAVYTCQYHANMRGRITVVVNP